MVSYPGLRSGFFHLGGGGASAPLREPESVPGGAAISGIPSATGVRSCPQSERRKLACEHEAVGPSIEETFLSTLGVTGGLSRIE